jgi:hypothetical protein
MSSGGSASSEVSRLEMGLRARVRFAGCAAPPSRAFPGRFFRVLPPLRS